MGSFGSKIKDMFTGIKEDSSKSNFLGMAILGVVNIITSIILKYVIGFEFSIIGGITDLFKSLFGGSSSSESTTSTESSSSSSN